MIYPSTATLTGDEAGTATLTPPSGFGDAFGDAFGGWVAAADAVIADPTGSAATLMELPAIAELAFV